MTETAYGYCGMPCALCTRYRTEGKSRCVGCSHDGYYTDPCKVHHCCREKALARYNNGRMKRKRTNMRIRTILFDLDGTLLPMDQEVFTKSYFKLLTDALAPHGYDAKRTIDAVWTGTKQMVRNDGSRSNEEAFWEKYSEVTGDDLRAVKPLFDAFYRNDFHGAAAFCGYTPQAKQTVDACRAAGYRIALATNPIFPATATEQRIRWAGLEPEDFAFYTTYENIGYSKPNPEYYRALLARLDEAPSHCLMVGNDVEEDMIAETVGMRVFLLTDCLINARNRDISGYPHGSFAQLREWLGADAEHGNGMAESGEQS